VVDWHGSIVREIQTLYPAVDANAFALAWRAGYQPAMARVRSGELGWTRIDELHRLILEDLLPNFGLSHLAETERVHLNRVWHRLDAWPDSVAGLQDCVLSAEVFRAYKPDPATYLGVASTFDLQPHQVMLCAAHHDDLEGARASGLRTVYIERPLEFGAAQPKDVSPLAGNDLHARDIHALADLLGC
jgi:2-haloacid dehalogenase